MCGDFQFVSQVRNRRGKMRQVGPTTIRVSTGKLSQGTGTQFRWQKNPSKIGWPQCESSFSSLLRGFPTKNKKRTCTGMYTWYIDWFCFDIPQQICWHICWHFHGKTYFDIILDRTDTFNYDNILAFYDLITLHVTCVLTCSLDMLYISLSLQTVQTWWYLVCHKFCHVIWDMFWNIFQHFTCHNSDICSLF